MEEQLDLACKTISIVEAAGAKFSVRLKKESTNVQKVLDVQLHPKVLLKVWIESLLL